MGGGAALGSDHCCEAMVARASGVGVQPPQVKCRKHQGEVRERRVDDSHGRRSWTPVPLGGPAKSRWRNPTNAGPVVRSMRVGGRVRVGARSGEELYPILTFFFSSWAQIGQWAIRFGLGLPF
ncbi:hypothetical protein NL676_007722 [Syzygium grande]|nr:hypothetical protein NL676_007722 [Syzygium grande]